MAYSVALAVKSLASEIAKPIANAFLALIFASSTVSFVIKRRLGFRLQYQTGRPTSSRLRAPRQRQMADSYSAPMAGILSAVDTLGWIGATMALAWVVRKPNNS